MVKLKDEYLLVIKNIEYSNRFICERYTTETPQQHLICSTFMCSKKLTLREQLFGNVCATCFKPKNKYGKLQG